MAFNEGRTYKWTNINANSKHRNNVAYNTDNFGNYLSDSSSASFITSSQTDVWFRKRNDRPFKRSKEEGTASQASKKGTNDSQDMDMSNQAVGGGYTTHTHMGGPKNTVTHSRKSTSAQKCNYSHKDLGAVSKTQKPEDVFLDPTQNCPKIGKGIKPYVTKRKIKD